MSNEVVLKKADGEYFAYVPELGIVTRAPAAEQAYEAALLKRQEIEAAFETAGIRHLLVTRPESLEVKIWSKRLKNWIAASLAIYFIGLLLLGFVIKNSADRMIASVQMSVAYPDPARLDKNLVKFRQLLEKYRPFIEEWNKVNRPVRN